MAGRRSFFNFSKQHHQPYQEQRAPQNQSKKYQSKVAILLKASKSILQYFTPSKDDTNSGDFNDTNPGDSNDDAKRAVTRAFATLPDHLYFQQLRMRLVMHCHIATDYLRVMLMYKLMAVA
jgi:hypothetical protein